MYTKTPNKNPYLYSRGMSPNYSGPGSILSKATNSRKPSVQPNVQFNMPTLNLERIKDTDTDSEYTYNPRIIGNNMNSMLSR